MSTSRDYASIYDATRFRINQKEKLEILTQKEARDIQLVEMYSAKRKEKSIWFSDISDLIERLKVKFWSANND